MPSKSYTESQSLSAASASTYYSSTRSSSTTTRDEPYGLTMFKQDVSAQLCTTCTHSSVPH
ncbi:hypothetical protein BCR33DRAFT_713324, partial [Rhizoclosmatium globosum]